MRTDYESGRSVGRLDNLGGCVPYWIRAPKAFGRKPETYRNGYIAGWAAVPDERAGTERFWRTDAQRQQGRLAGKDY